MRVERYKLHLNDYLFLLETDLFNCCVLANVLGMVTLKKAFWSDILWITENINGFTLEVEN